jgi:predicted RNA polymerase sigma factor
MDNTKGNDYRDLENELQRLIFTCCHPILLLEGRGGLIEVRPVVEFEPGNIS